MTPAKFAATTAVLGFVIAVGLARLAFSGVPWSAKFTWVFLVLCPPSIGAISLDNASRMLSVLAWFLFALTNAGLYAVVGWITGWLVSGRQEKPH